jgi:hypothetical protein
MLLFSCDNRPVIDTSFNEIQVTLCIRIFADMCGSGEAYAK